MELYTYLHKRVLITSKSRYEASRRLRMHSLCSQWTLAFMAVGQIVLSLIAVFELNAPVISVNLQNSVGLFFAIVVLTYSLLLGMGDFSARASNIHQCGLELSELARELNYKVVKKESSSEEKYMKYVQRFYTCLSRHENHITHDYLIAKLDVAQENDNKLGFFKKWFSFKAKIYFFRVIGFLHYPVSILSIIAWISYLLIK
ncbi:SLATT domain-containing protein [Pseudoalteromonas agarivorans]|uniref:Uncharacterized protein n=1 Tax=Pseudoalteromonas agarivorans DSM 14585 TaxID=1312369 RepID=A0ACA8E0C8_9GAMM|nr:SLATT domain-containing protein [Pseudoalteromonas agarivorans]ATC83794.1 hypothetical protein PAGA_a3695 [Pseudoalteromonas agarivorans DSM 14585]